MFWRQPIIDADYYASGPLYDLSRPSSIVGCATDGISTAVEIDEYRIFSIVWGVELVCGRRVEEEFEGSWDGADS